MIPTPTPVQTESPAIVTHQIVDDDLFTKAAGTIGFVVPRQAFEDIDNATLKYIHFVQMQLLKCTEDIRLADGRQIPLLQVLMPQVTGLSIHQSHHARLQHQIAPDTTVNIAGNGRQRFIDLFGHPAIVTMPGFHRPVLRCTTANF